MDKHQKLGFIGLGLMGMPMTRRLIEAGYEVTVWNRNLAKTEPMISLGAHGASTVAELVAQSDIVMLCVSNTQAVEAIVFGQGGIAQTANSQQILVDFSSIDPQATRQFSERLASQCGMQWLDAPVSGGVAGAESGTLVVMAGGDRAVVDSLRPILMHLSQRVTHMGPVGSGQTTKICNQLLVSCNILVMAEVMALAEKAGVDSSKIPAALKGGFADSIPLQLTGTRMVNRDFDDIKWHVKTLLKDLDMGMKLTSALGASAPMAQLGAALMQDYADTGYAERDPCTLIEVYNKK